MVKNQIISQKYREEIYRVISGFEEVIKKHGAFSVQEMKNSTRIEKIYEVPSKGGIIARFTQYGAPSFIMSTDDNVTTSGNALIMYLGFDESSEEFNSIFSDVYEYFRRT